MYIHVRTKVGLRIAKKIILLALIAAAFTFLQINSLPYYRNALLKNISCVFVLGIYIYIFYKVKLIPLLRDKHWVGTVQGRTARKATVIRGPIPHKGNIEDVVICKWHIVKETGEEEFIDYETGVIGDRYFLPGDQVRHYKGAKLIVRANPAEDDENLFCPLCGKMVMRPRCSFCKVRFDTP